MSPIKKPNAINRDYGRRPEMKGGKDAPGWKGYLRGGGRSNTYRELISRETEKVAGSRWQDKHSEYKKPYYEDEFPEMEHFYSPPVGDVTGGYDPYRPPTKGLTECWDVCRKNHSGMYTDDDCYVYIWLHVALSLVASSIEFIFDHEGTLNGFGEVRKIYKSVSPSSDGVEIIWQVQQPLFEACPSVRDLAANSCKKTYTEAAECGECPPEIAISWDDDTSADTVVREDFVTVAITGGIGPYSWSVSGTGFTLDAEMTDDELNTLNADDTACGSATITVTDFCGEEAIGYVRCITVGDWCPIESFRDGDEACGMEPEGKTGGPPPATTRYTKVEGKYKVEEDYLTPVGFSTCGGATAACNNLVTCAGYTLNLGCGFNCLIEHCAEMHTTFNQDTECAPKLCTNGSLLVYFCVTNRIKYEWGCAC